MRTAVAFNDLFTNLGWVKSYLTSENKHINTLSKSTWKNMAEFLSKSQVHRPWKYLARLIPYSMAFGDVGTYLAYDHRLALYHRLFLPHSRDYTGRVLRLFSWNYSHTCGNMFYGCIKTTGFKLSHGCCRTLIICIIRIEYPLGVKCVIRYRNFGI